ncbi:MAG: diguanylate cyclase (GGDEF)-like protein [Sulfurimonas sp.]|jgi:diguanylate cyclase (GGDEF)-like protein|uniref:GGDEF domain-containing protein n=1 Tax=Sulfurimonas sp. TaxID=2022749 RepID=UPI0039E7068C
MINIQNDEIKDLISIDMFNDTSLFAVYVVNITTNEILYANQAMKNIMSDMTAKYCWEAINGQDAPCSWCQAPTLLAGLKPSLHHSQSTVNNGYIIYEHFNEVANKWYQVQEKVVQLKDSRNALISFALDISIQKEAQSKLIDTHVKIARQTKELKETQAKLKEQANRDPLTNMYNRRYFADFAEKIISITKRTNEPLSLLMIDIDDFKRINDTYGHNIGDNVIIFLAETITLFTRESDIAARFGGEEFAIILPNTSTENAVKLAEKLRLRIEKMNFQENDTNIKFTISIGVDAFNHQSDTNISESLNRADKALYQSKTSGKNKVSLF